MSEPSRTAFEPAYLGLYESGMLRERVEQAKAQLANCRVCPRNCRVDRLADKFAVCKTGRYAVTSSHFAHFGEEDCLRGRRGSRTIFFSGCNLRCVFCQNYDISWELRGRPVPPDELAGMMLDLQGQGCHNINFVTPEHVVPQIVEAIAFAIERGMRLPLVYNTSGYDSMDSLRLLDGLVDIYMPDFKWWDREAARKYSKAPDYPEVARRTLKEMHRQVGDLILDEEGLAKRGLLVRHLLMPGGQSQSTGVCGNQPPDQGGRVRAGPRRFPARGPEAARFAAYLQGSHAFLRTHADSAIGAPIRRML